MESSRRPVYRLAAGGFAEVSIHDCNPRDPGQAPSHGVGYFIANMNRSGTHGAREASEILAIAQYGLNWHAERFVCSMLPAWDAFKMSDKGRSLIPRHGLRRCRDVIAVTGRHWNGAGLQEAEACNRTKKIALDLAEPRLAPAGEARSILLTASTTVGDAHQLQNRRVPPGLLLQPMARVDQHHGGIGVTRAARHVSRVLIVPGAVDENEPALAGVQIALSDIDRDALLALGGEPIEKQAISREGTSSAI